MFYQRRKGQSGISIPLPAIRHKSGAAGGGTPGKQPPPVTSPPRDSAPARRLKAGGDPPCWGQECGAAGQTRETHLAGDTNALDKGEMSAAAQRLAMMLRREVRDLGSVLRQSPDAFLALAEPPGREGFAHFSSARCLARTTWISAMFQDPFHGPGLGQPGATAPRTSQVQTFREDAARGVSVHP